MPSYDYPFNERIRTLLRVEDLFAKVLYNVDGDHEYQHHCALLTLLQILDVVDRAELKLDLLQELDRQKNALRLLIGNPAIVADALQSTLADINTALDALRGETNKIGQTLRANEWLMSIKQRAGIPGGVCEFDVPSYHYWLKLDSKNENRIWKLGLNRLYQCIGRLSLFCASCVAVAPLQNSPPPNGVYQQMLGGAKPAQMLKIEIADTLTCFPEVSANKYAINIRFNTLDYTQKPQKYEEDVEFSFTLCNL